MRSIRRNLSMVASCEEQDGLTAHQAARPCAQHCATENPLLELVRALARHAAAIDHAHLTNGEVTNGGNGGTGPQR